jgi:hypothetical protein
LFCKEKGLRSSPYRHDVEINAKEKTSREGEALNNF